MPLVVVESPPTQTAAEAERLVVEAPPFNEERPVMVKAPESEREVNVPTEVREEAVIPEPKVEEVKTSVPAI